MTRDEIISIARKPFRKWLADNWQVIDLRKVDRYWFLGLAFESESLK